MEMFKGLIFFYHDQWGSKGTMRHVRVSIFQIQKVTKIGIKFFLHRNKLKYPHILFELVNLYLMFNQCKYVTSPL